MKCIKTTDAVGHVLCHDITRIVKDVVKDTAFRKGHIVQEEDIPVLLSLGKDHLYVWEKDENTLHENEAAQILCDVCINENMHPTDVKEGKIELIADCDGVFQVDVPRLDAINEIDEIMIATRHTNFPVKKGDRLLGTRVIPLVIDQKKLDEAKKLVKEKVEKMGITDLQFSNWNYAVCKSFEGDNSSGNFGNGYRIDYARTINGVPVTQTIADGGALEDMDSTMETWSYESLCFYVDKDGIESMTYSNPYTIGKIKTENLNLLSFSEVMKIYEKMMVVTNADNMQYENSRVYNIDRIVLGYARIYEPSTDAHTGILIPVWDFFGSMTSESEYNGETESNTIKTPNESFLTINAVDGSIIDRNLGY